MPVYEYKCTKCHEQFEVIQKFSDDPLKNCEACGGKLRKLITNTSFVLKGSGWYVTDYPSSDRKRATDKKKSSASRKDDKSEKKTDDKKKAVNA